MAMGHWVELHVDEERYAEESGSEAERAERAAAEADAYPVIYQEPFKSVGCGYGMLGKHVEKAGVALANRMGLDWECCHQVTVGFTLYCGTAEQYREFEMALCQELESVRKWVRGDLAGWAVGVR